MEPDFLHDFTEASIPSGFTLTRASSGTYVNSSGVIVSATNNTPRFDYHPVTHACRGLLIERQRTNLFLYAQDFTNSVWTKTGCSVSADSMSAPDGTTTGDTISEDSGHSAHGVGVTYSFSSNVTYALSCFARAGARTQIKLAFPAAAFGAEHSAIFDLSGGTVASTSGTVKTRIEAFGNGWYRCSLHAIATATASGDVTFGMCNALSSTYTGDGTSGLYLWGAQFEIGIAATSYIATTSAQVTRAGDSLLGLTASLPWWTSGSEFTIACRAETTAVDGNVDRYLFLIDNGATSNRMFSYILGANYTLLTTSSSTTVVNIQHALGSTALMTALAAFKENDFASYIPDISSSIQTDMVGAMPTGLSQIRLGCSGTAGQLNGWFKTFRYWNTKLTNSEIGDIT